MSDLTFTDDELLEIFEVLDSASNKLKEIIKLKRVKEYEEVMKLEHAKTKEIISCNKE